MEAEIEAAIRDVSRKQRKEFTKFHFAESQQCVNKQQREWHNKSLTSFPLSLWAQLGSWSVARQRNYSWASPSFLSLSVSLCVVLLLGATAGWAPTKLTHTQSHKSPRAHKCVHTARGKTQPNRAHKHELSTETQTHNSNAGNIWSNIPARHRACPLLSVPSRRHTWGVQLLMGLISLLSGAIETSSL